MARRGGYSWTGSIFRLIGGLILMGLIWPGGDLSFWNMVLYWTAIIMISEGGAWVAIRNHEDQQDYERWR